MLTALELRDLLNELIAQGKGSYDVAISDECGDWESYKIEVLDDTNKIRIY